MNWRWSCGIDVLALLVFVAIGLRSHDDLLARLPITALPFVIAVLVAYAIAGITERLTMRMSSLLGGIYVVVVTAVLGIALRGLMGGGLSGSFPLVASAFIALFLLGWRLIALAIMAIRASTDA